MLRHCRLTEDCRRLGAFCYSCFKAHAIAAHGGAGTSAAPDAEPEPKVVRKPRQPRGQRPTLTHAFVARLEPPMFGYAHYWDGEIERFGIRVSAATGKKVWIIDYTVDGRRYRKVLGTWPTMRDDEARDLAIKVRAKARNGEHAEEIAPRARPSGVLGAPASMWHLASEWLDKVRRYKRTASADESVIRKYILPHFGPGTPVSSIRLIHVVKLHRQITDSGSPIAANRVLSLMAAMFTYAEQLGLRPQNDNPCKGVEKNPENKREEYLTRKGVARLMEACELHSDRRIANLVRWLLFTGCRRGQALAAGWSDFETDDETGTITWVKPSAHTKTRETHRVPLNKPAAELWCSMQAQATSRFLFPADDPMHHLVDVKKGWKSICKRAGVEGLHLHDLRHSYASALVMSGVPLAVVGKLLGHTQTATTLRYSHVDDDTLLVASNNLIEFLPNKAKADGA
jgi:integrase